MSASFSLKELREPSECARRPLFSIVLSQGLMIHVLIHMLYWGSCYSCSQYWIIKALCARQSHCPSFVYSLLSGSHSLSFAYSCFPLCLSVFEPNCKLPYLHLSFGLLHFHHLLNYMCKNFSVIRIQWWLVHFSQGAGGYTDIKNIYICISSNSGYYLNCRG